MNRARKGQKAFNNVEDHNCFIDIVKDASEIFNLKVSAYCLMSNHYHLLVQTPDANLSRCMRHINGIFTQRYNARNGYDGTLFRGRYKSILIDADSYLLELVRYIHRNPLRAGLVDKLGDYEWSSHKGYVSKAKEWEWLHKKFILDIFSTDKKLQIAAYKRYVSLEESEDLSKYYSKKNTPSIIGREDFVNSIKKRFSKKKKETEIPESEKLCPEAVDIKRAVCAHYEIKEADLLKSQRGLENEPRDLAIYMLRMIRAERLTEIGKEFNLSHYSSVSTAVDRARRKMGSRKFRKMYEEILDDL
jgi:REP element-mobilizing transposase RayT